MSQSPHLTVTSLLLTPSNLWAAVITIRGLTRDPPAQYLYQSLLILYKCNEYLCYICYSLTCNVLSVLQYGAHARPLPELSLVLLGVQPGDGLEVAFLIVSETFRLSGDLT